MTTTTTEKYIKKAVEEAKRALSGNSISNCSFHMNMEADGATQILAAALKKQAEANEINSRAMLKLAESLKPKDACAIRISEGDIEVDNVRQR